MCIHGGTSRTTNKTCLNFYLFRNDKHIGSRKKEAKRTAIKQEGKNLHHLISMMRDKHGVGKSYVLSSSIVYSMYIHNRRWVPAMDGSQLKARKK